MGPHEQPQEEIATLVQTTRILVLALCFGVLVFAAVVLMQTRPDPQAPFGLLTALATVMALSAIGMSFLLPRVIAGRQCRQIAAGTWQPPQQVGAPPADSDSSKLAAVYLSKTILGAALLEGAAFLALVAHMIERHVASLALAGLLFLALLAYLPTAAGVQRWLDERLRWLQEQRQFSR